MAEFLQYFLHLFFLLVVAMDIVAVSKGMALLLASIAVMMIRIVIQNIVGAEGP
jgi:hypothetical protein